jgi:hypothetical protein
MEPISILSMIAAGVAMASSIAKIVISLSAQKHARPVLEKDSDFREVLKKLRERRHAAQAQVSQLKQLVEQANSDSERARSVAKQAELETERVRSWAALAEAIDARVDTMELSKRERSALLEGLRQESAPARARFAQRMFD